MAGRRWGCHARFGRQLGNPLHTDLFFYAVAIPAVIFTGLAKGATSLDQRNAQEAEKL